MSKVNIRGGLHELIDTPVDSPLWNHDLDPTTIDRRKWHKWNIVALWIGLAVCIPTYMLGSSLIGSGMNWWQAMLTILFGNVIVLAPMVLIGHAGTKYGIPFPVFLRASFGVQGARVASLFRAIVACGWFGIQSWLGGEAIYHLSLVFFPGLAHTVYLGSFIGLNTAQLSSFLFFWVIQMFIVYHGIDWIRYLATWAAPLLILIGVALLVWAWTTVGSFGKVLNASHFLGGKTYVSFWKIFWPGLTGIVGFWSTLALNIPDFTRFAKSQKDQVIGQAIGLPLVMVFYSFIGIFVTSATVIIFGKAMWDPVALLGQFSNPVVVIISMMGIILATICSNLTANVVSPSNDFSNFWPKLISFRTGGIITGVIGILIFPWKLIADPQGYIFRWLIAYSALLGALGGIMICDYFIIRKTRLYLDQLFAHKGHYHFFCGWNLIGFLSFLLSVIPCIPGFLVNVSLAGATTFPHWMTSFYNYAWFVSFALAFVIYWGLMSIWGPHEEKN